MKKPGITFIIQSPSPDLDSEDYAGVKFYIRGAVHNVTQIRELCQIPDHVLAFVIKSFTAGNYRAEILVGEVQYKFYKKVERELIPQEQSDTKLEQFQKKICKGIECNDADKSNAFPCSGCPMNRAHKVIESHDGNGADTIVLQ